MVLDFATKKAVRKIFRRYVQNKHFLDDLTQEIIYHKGEMIPAAKSGNCDKVLRAVVEIEKQAEKALKEINAVEATVKYFRGTKQEMLIDHLYFKGYREDVRAAATRAEITPSYAYLLLNDVITYCYLRLKEYKYFGEEGNDA